MSLFRNLHALPPFTAEDLPTVIPEKIRAMFGAPTHPEDGGHTAISYRVVPETLSPEVTHESSVTTAYLDKFVPLPVLHGDQPIHG